MDVRAIYTPPLTTGAPAQNQRRNAGIPEEPAPLREEKSVGPQRHPVLSVEEQRYFENLFPDPQTDSRGRPAYTDGGARSQMRSGTIVDRRV